MIDAISFLRFFFIFTLGIVIYLLHRNVLLPLGGKSVDLTSRTYYQTWSKIIKMPRLPPTTYFPFVSDTFPATDLAICILTPFAPENQSQTWHLATQIRTLAGNSTTVFILSDALAVTEVAMVTTNKVFIVGIEPGEARRHGFQKSDGFIINKDVIAWDKFYYLFCHVLKSHYKFVMAFEWDVFVPSREAYQQLERSLFRTTVDSSSSQSNVYFDLVTQGEWGNYDGHTTRIDQAKKRTVFDWHWQRIQNRPIPLPWFGSMMCVQGLSNRLLAIIEGYASRHNRLEFVEIFGITLARHNNLTVNHPPCLSTIAFKAQWECKDIRQLPTNIFHPVKNYSLLTNC